MKKLIWKILLPFTAISVFIIVASAVASQYTLKESTNVSTNLLENQLGEQKKMVETVTTNSVDDIISSSVLLAQQLALQENVVEGVKQNNAPLIHESLQEAAVLAKEKANIDLIWITRLDDRTADGFTPILACPSNRDFDGFTGLKYDSTNEALDKGEVVYSWEVNEEDGKLQVSAPIFDNGRVIGAVVVGQQTYQPFVKKIADSTNTGSTLFLTPDQESFYIMTDSKTDELGSEFFEASRENLAQKAKNVDELVSDSELYQNMISHLERARSTKEITTGTIIWKEQPYIMQFQPLISKSGEVSGVLVNRFPGVAALQESIAEKTNSIQMISYIVSVLLLIISVGVSFFISRKITHPINQMSRITSRVAQGDLQVEPLSIKSKDEIGQLSGHFNHMVKELREIVGKVSQASTLVKKNSEELTIASIELQEGNMQIVSTMQEISSGVEDQAVSATDLSEGMKEFVEKVEEASDNSENVVALSRNIVQLTESGKGQMNKSVKQMDVIYEIVKDSVEKVRELDHKSKEISKLVRVIQEISEQTNLLSLNAAIEAARAGEHGRGFAIVAAEVRKLSEQVSHSVTDITEIVSGIQSESNKVATALESGYKEVETGSVQIQETGDMFNRIDGSVEEMVHRVQRISDYLKDVVKASHSMNQSIENVAAVSEESAAGIELTTASVQQTSSSTEEVASSAGELKTLAQELNEQINRFKI